MSPLERTEDYSANYPERYLQGDYLKDEAKFMTKVARLVEKLRSSLAPTRVQYDLEFLPQDDGVYLYPEALQDRLLTRNLDRVTVSIVKEAGVPATTTVQLSDEDGEIYISRDSEAPDPSSDDVVVNRDGSITRIDRLPDNEVQALLLSVAGKHFDAFLALEAPDTPIIDAINQIDALEQHGINSTLWFEYLLPSGRTVRFDVERSLRERLNAFSITYEVGEVPGAMTARVDRQVGLSIDFKKREEGESTTLIPQGGDYIRLIEIIEAEIDSINSQNKAQRLSKKAINSASLVEAVPIDAILDQDGFDSPNSGAA